MTRIRKSYFTLEELASGWGLPEADLRYVAENGLLKLSVRVVGVFMEFGILGRSGGRGASDVDPVRTVATTTGWSISTSATSSRCSVTAWSRPRSFRQAMATPRYGGTRTSSSFDRAISWCGMTSASGSRRRCCRPCASRRQASATSPISGTKAADIVSRRHRRRCCASCTKRPSAGALGSPARQCSPRSARSRSSSATSSSGGRSGVTWSRRDGCGLYRLALALTHRRAA